MGTYLYRITAQKRKMTTGEEVRILKYLSKPSWRYGAEEPYRQDNGTEECLAVWDFEQATPVFRFKAGSSLWYDYDEDRKEEVGYLLRDGRRWRMVHEKLGHELGLAYGLIESKGNDENRCYTMGGSRYMKSWWKGTDGRYHFELIEGTNSDGPVVYSNCFNRAHRTDYASAVYTIADCLKKLYKKESELEGLREAG